MSEKKKHADFQDEYRKSSNFGKIQQSEDLKIKGDGELKVVKDAEMKTKSEERKISETLNFLVSEYHHLQNECTIGKYVTLQTIVSDGIKIMSFKIFQILCV